MARLTVKDLLDARGKHQFAMLRVETLEEAEAAEKAGVELLSIPPAMLHDRRFRDVAPNAFAFPGDNFYEIGDTADFLKWAFPLYKAGADGFYCSGSLQTVRAMADHGLPVCGHVGLIPSKRTWTGGFKAVGKTADSAMAVYERCKRYEEVGAFGVEIEVVPPEVTAEIAKHTNLFLVSMGGGKGGDCQYLFACDVLGTNTGHVPRHSKQYANLAREFARIQQMRIDAFKEWVGEVHSGAWPDAPYVVAAPADEMNSFKTMMAKK